MTDRQTDRHRLDYIDACKGYGIILVILGHVFSFPRILYLIIYSFHMPLFFILSGYVFCNSRYSFKCFFYRKVSKLIIPYFMFAVINLILDILWNIFVLKKIINIDYFCVKLKGIILCYSNVENMPNCSPLWFLIALFFASLILYGLTKIDTIIASIISAIFVISSFILSTCCVLVPFFPWKFPAFLMGAAFMYLGFLFRKFSFDKYFRNSRLISVFVLLLCLFGIFVECISQNEINMNGNQYGNLIVLVSLIINSLFGWASVHCS